VSSLGRPRNVRSKGAPDERPASSALCSALIFGGDVTRDAITDSLLVNVLRGSVSRGADIAGPASEAAGACIESQDRDVTALAVIAPTSLDGSQPDTQVPLVLAVDDGRRPHVRRDPSSDAAGLAR
jgi:hypothetical protein